MQQVETIQAYRARREISASLLRLFQENTVEFKSIISGQLAEDPPSPDQIMNDLVGSLLSGDLTQVQQSFCSLPFERRQGNDYKKAEEAAVQSGRYPVLEKDFELAMELAGSARNEMGFIQELLKTAKVHTTFLHDAGGVTLRARPALVTEDTCLSVRVVEKLHQFQAAFRSAPWSFHAVFDSRVIEAEASTRSPWPHQMTPVVLVLEKYHTRRGACFIWDRSDTVLSVDRAVTDLRQWYKDGCAAPRFYDDLIPL